MGITEKVKGIMPQFAPLPVVLQLPVDDPAEPQVEVTGASA